MTDTGIAVPSIKKSTKIRDGEKWAYYYGYDLTGKGDVGWVKTDKMSFDDLLQMVIDNGWSGFTLHKGTAYFKKIDAQLSLRHLNAKNGCETWVYNPDKGQETVIWHRETKTNYDYSKGVVGLVGDSTVARISVAANNDAHIGLGETEKHTSDKYEVVIGGWGNT